MIDLNDSALGASGYRLKGKVASLPHALREQVCQHLLNGWTYVQVAEWLEKETQRPWNVENLSNWHGTGYQKWLKNRESIEAIAARRDAALAMVQSLKADGQSAASAISEANDQLLASHIYEALSEFDPASLKALLVEDPKKFFNLAMSITAQTNERTKREALELQLSKYRDQVADTKAKLLAATTQARAGGLSAEALAQIEAAAALL